MTEPHPVPDSRRAARSTPTPARPARRRSCSKAASAASRSSTPARTATHCGRRVKGDDRLWTYMSAYGPFADREGVRRVARRPRRARRPLLLRGGRHADGRAVGIVTLMEIRPAMRVIEVGSIVYSPACSARRSATEAQYLLARYVFDDARLPALRVEVQRAQRPLAARRARSASPSRGSSAST